VTPAVSGSQGERGAAGEEAGDAELAAALRAIPDKTYYRIGEVARIAQLKPYVLRFWETEFNVIAPSKSRSKQRMYRKKDIETILRIKQLLYHQGFTIKGARRKLLELGAAARSPEPALPTLGQVRSALEEIRSLLMR
jgi:DNA-binding transcriptional MerR regulator